MNELRDALDTASAEQVLEHLNACDRSFVPRLSERVKLAAYAHKLIAQARRFETWSEDGWLVGLVALYDNQRSSGTAFVTHVSVRPGWTGRGLARHLLGQAIAHSRSIGLRRVSLDVSEHNLTALALYDGLGFNRASASASGWLRLELNLIPSVEIPSP